MKWRNGARKLLQLIPLLRSISSPPPSVSLNLLSFYTPHTLFPFFSFLWFVPPTHIDPHALDPVGGLVLLHYSTAHEWCFPYGSREGGRHRRRKSVSGKHSSLSFQGGGSWMWFMINSAPPITFKLNTTLKHSSGTLYSRTLLTDFALGVLNPWQQPSTYMCAEEKATKTNVSFITVRLWSSSKG